MVVKRVKILAMCLIGVQSFDVRAGDYVKSDRLIFDFYSPKWVNAPFNVNSEPTFSFTASWGKDIPFNSSRFSFFYGLGYDFSTVNNNLNLKSVPASEGALREMGIRVLNVPYSLNRLSTQYIEFPLEIRFRTQTKHPLRFYLGGKLGYMTRSSYNLDEGNGFTYKRKSLSELDRLKYGTTLRFGCGMVNFYAYYGFNDLMSSEKQTGINQLSFGFTLLAN
ncbi:MAG: hypothetical protein CMD35_06250 [Flavobacteriales bacterium]|nr:hypothetical protein [Flavobacteriales bacterium]|tara:strand:+ start:96 stop:758 length:663 start_codon:yes stop_codon:yes gene_type:complete